MKLTRIFLLIISVYLTTLGCYTKSSKNYHIEQMGEDIENMKSHVNTFNNDYLSFDYPSFFKKEVLIAEKNMKAIFLEGNYTKISIFVYYGSYGIDDYVEQAKNRYRSQNGEIDTVYVKEVSITDITRKFGSRSLQGKSITHKIIDGSVMVHDVFEFKKTKNETVHILIDYESAPDQSLKTKEINSLNEIVTTSFKYK